MSRKLYAPSRGMCLLVGVLVLMSAECSTALGKSPVAESGGQARWKSPVLTLFACADIRGSPYSEWRRERALRCHSNRPIERWVLVLSPSSRTSRREMEDKGESASFVAPLPCRPTEE